MTIALPPRAFHPLDPRGARQRLLFAVLIGVAAYVAVPSRLATTTRALIAWDLGGFALLALATVIIVRADPDETQRRAAAHDPGRMMVWLLVLASSAFSLFAAALVLHQAKGLPRLQGDLHLAMSIGAVAISWLLTHTAFTLRYAHLYYRDEDGGAGGIEVPGGERPDDLDFAYFAFTIGMCFQVSDFAVSSRLVRRTVLAHALLSFGYNTVILALALNLVFGQLA